MTTERIETVIIGAGQAGLAVSHELTRAGVEHVVLERGRVGQSWRGRWDSFCLVAPNWTVRLPGGAYDGDDPDGFMARDEIVAHLERYAHGFEAPVHEGVDVGSLRRGARGGHTVPPAPRRCPPTCCRSTSSATRQTRVGRFDTEPPDLGSRAAVSR